MTAEAGFADMALDLRLLRALEKKGYAKPTPVQAAAIPAALQGKDLVVRACTGSGKTLGYAVPALHKILSGPAEQAAAGWQALILVPTRELCEQVRAEAEELAQLCGGGLRVTSLAPEQPAARRAAVHSAGQVVVATPGQVAQALREGRLRAGVLQGEARLRRRGLATLVLDEADLMLAMPGYAADLEALAPLVPRGCQCLLMSATVNDKVERLQQLVLHNALTLNLLGGAVPRGPVPGDIKQEEDPAQQPALGPSGAAAEIEHFSIHCASGDRLLTVMVLLRLGLAQRRALLFVNTIDAAYRLRLFLAAFGTRAALLHAELPLNTRHHILQTFNKGLYDYLIAADDPAKRDAPAAEPKAEPGPKGAKRKRKVAPDAEFGVVRGIDFKGVATVINVDLPEDPSVYVHRVGRTGRAGQAGTALSLFTPEDAPLEAELQQLLGRPDPAADPLAPRLDAPRQRGLQPFARLTPAAVEHLRYRGEDIARSLTKSVVKEARAKELRQELLNSARLKEHFEARPGDLAVLRHDRPIAAAAAPAHLRHLPAYLRDPAAAPLGSLAGAAATGQLPRKKRQKLQAGLDPLRGRAGGFVRAPKRGEEASEPLTEMEQRATEKGLRDFKKAQKRAPAPATPKVNVRKRRAKR